ncbi:MAG: PPC domain-containing protein [Deltaproteobacteria bacterium]|nr:PPC domain-containing protein [Deltaproteobacteria bacterium]
MPSLLRKCLLCAAALQVALLVGCANGPPEFATLLDQTAYVEQEFTLQLRATDPDGDEITFTYAVADIEGIVTRASIQPVAKGEAMFRYTPIISDVGTHTFDFIADDGKAKRTQTIAIKVEISESSGTGPTFRKPVGTGTTLDLAQKDCGTLDVVVEDPDSAEVDITQEDPVIAGASLAQDSGLTARWTWCPSTDQIAASDRYMLRLGADDGTTRVTKDYLIVLRKPQKTDCPGTAPVITHQPEDDNTLLPLIVFADVTDDKGIKNEPLLYYSLTQPPTPPDVGAMTQVSMILLWGDMKSGTWGVEFPNPVVSQPVGTRADVWYVIVAQDNDDEAGDCDHLTQMPATGSYQMSVTRPPDGQGRGLCEACTADVQCGGANDNCLVMGTGGESFCFKACTQDSDCGDPLYYCSLTEWTSVDGVKARQCIPNTFRCPPEPACQDDTREPNDSLAGVQTTTALAAGSYPSLKLCPAGSGLDEDWYPIEITADTEVTASITATAPPDLDLALVNSSGVVVTKSDGLTANESLTSCLGPGRYYLRVYGFGTVASTYTLTYGKVAKSCQVCEDDYWEDDDNATQARVVNLGSGRYYSDTNAICANDDDWFKVQLTSGQKLYATVAFTQASASEDLDIRFYQQGSGSTVVDLTHCTEVDPTGCVSTNGQSTTSNENFTYTATTTGTYYVVVHGWEGSENLYDICIALSNVAGTGCPPLAK